MEIQHIAQTLNPAQRAIQLEDQYGAHNYHPLPVVLLLNLILMFLNRPNIVLI